MGETEAVQSCVAAIGAWSAVGTSDWEVGALGSAWAGGCGALVVCGEVVGSSDSALEVLLVVVLVVPKGLAPKALSVATVRPGLLPTAPAVEEGGSGGLDVGDVTGKQDGYRAVFDLAEDFGPSEPPGQLCEDKACRALNFSGQVRACFKDIGVPSRGRNALDDSFPPSAISVAIGKVDVEGVKRLEDLLSDGYACVGAGRVSCLELDTPIAGAEGCQESQFLECCHPVYHS